MILLSPWEEEFLHWSYEDNQWRLHGHYLPAEHRCRSVTHEGWCPAAYRRPRGQSSDDAGNEETNRDLA
ncbi:hypothetical protein SAMN04489718_0437 [Actinopolyspora saharensis]|uniref:Uncharacterized protein n=1 Tax=Actinopolyspora saharensis TaxID=995062 RepID=A0A1H0YGL9_9ACTN|nr:hypothetical protein SAMN04489718_0437 [Actinopolyspora saharensis]